MLQILKIILLVIVGVIIPCLVGMVYTSFKDKIGKLWLDLLSGYIILWALFEVMVLPSIVLKLSLQVFTYLYVLVVAVVVIYSIIKNKSNIKCKLVNTFGSFVKMPLVTWIAVILIIGQTFYVVQNQHIDDDDAFYVATAETAVASNTLMEIDPYTGEPYWVLPSRYVLSPFPLYEAVMAKLIGVKPVTFAHTMLPALLIPLSYIIMYLIANVIFKNKKKDVGLFIIFVSFFNLYSAFSVYSQGTFLLTRLWQGKAVLAALLIPAVIYFVMQNMDEKRNIADYIMLLLLMISCCFVSTMGVMLGAIALGIMSLVDLFENKQIKRVLKLWVCCIPNVLCALSYILIR